MLSSQLARIMAVLQQQRQQQQVGGLSGSSKHSPSHHGGVVGGGPKLPGADPTPHPGFAGSVADLHQKTLGPYSSEQLYLWSLYKQTLLRVTLLSKANHLPCVCLHRLWRWNEPSWSRSGRLGGGGRGGHEGPGSSAVPLQMDDGRTFFTRHVVA